MKKRTTAGGTHNPLGEIIKTHNRGLTVVNEP